MLPDQNNISPDAKLRNSPPVNTIGGAVDPKTNSPALNRINADKRPLEALISVTNPKTGDVEKLSAFNARDMVRHHGWKYATDKKDDIIDEVEEKTAEPEDDAVLSAANKKLQAHRDVLVRMGVEVDNRWGMKRLVEEITRKGGLLPE